MALEERARSCLLRFRHKLEQDIKPSYLMDHMISDGVLTVDEEERIRTQVSLCFTCCCMLLPFVPASGSFVFFFFYHTFFLKAYSPRFNKLHILYELKTSSNHQIIKTFFHQLIK